MRRKDPAILFYSDNFLSGTMFMTDAQVGKYMRLLCAQHLMGHLTEEEMLKICASYDETIWRKFTKDADGKYYNERLEDEVSKRREYAESRSRNRIKGLNKRKEKDKKETASYEHHMEDENGNENINAIVNGIENEKEWKSILMKWALYRIEMGKPLQVSSIQGALKRLKELSNDNTERAMLIVKDSISNGYQGLFPAPNGKQKQLKTITEQWLS